MQTPSTGEVRLPVSTELRDLYRDHRWDLVRLASLLLHDPAEAEIDKVVKQTVDAKGAHVAVGYANPNGQLSTAAVIHLVRFGTGATAPWEVVGTDDPPSFALTTPAYGARVTSPATVRGTITGVDESVRVQVLQLSSSSPLGTAPGVAAGGSVSPWQTTVPWQGATDSVLTIAASTGGHLQGVERFTVTAVTTGK
jgi:hypothetical protein